MSNQKFTKISKLLLKEDEDNIASKVKNDIQFVVPLIKKYIVQFNKQHSNLLKKWKFNFEFWKPFIGVEDYFLVNYSWNKWIADNETDWSAFMEFEKGLDSLLTDNLKRKGWSYHINKEESDYGFLIKYFDRIKVQIDFYTGDNDGNSIGPNIIDNDIE